MFLMIYLLIGAVGKFTGLFGFQCIHSKSGSENAAAGLLLSMLAWPWPFAWYVKANLFDE